VLVVGSKPSSDIPDLDDAVFSSEDDFVEPGSGMKNGSDIPAFIQIQGSN